jgi:hypothetical protein
MKDTGVVDKETREPYRVVEAEEPRYGHLFDVIDIGMELKENRVFAPAVDEDHARQIASSANYWFRGRREEGEAKAMKEEPAHHTTTVFRAGEGEVTLDREKVIQEAVAALEKNLENLYQFTYKGVYREGNGYDQKLGAALDLLSRGLDFLGEAREDEEEEGELNTRCIGCGSSSPYFTRGYCVDCTRFEESRKES